MKPKPSIPQEEIKNVMKILEAKGMLYYTKTGIYAPTETGLKPILGRGPIRDEIVGYGSKDIVAKSKTEIKIVKDEKVNGSVICVKANKGASELNKELKEALKTSSIVNITIKVDEYEEKIVGYSSPALKIIDDKSIVIRKNDKIDDATISILANKAANDLGKEMKKALKNTNSVVKIIIEVIWTFPCFKFLTRLNLIMKKYSYSELVEKYGSDYQLFGRYDDLDRDKIMLFYRKGNDYLLVTSEGEEYQLKLETLDKVRDICCGNIRSLTEYELKILEKFSRPWFLEHLCEESMKRFLEREIGHEISDFDLFLINTIFDLYINPLSIIPRNEEEKRKEIEKIKGRVKKQFGIDVKLNSTFHILNQILIKTASDISFEREEFLKRIWHKKRKKKWIKLIIKNNGEIV